MAAPVDVPAVSAGDSSAFPLPLPLADGSAGVLRLADGGEGGEGGEGGGSGEGGEAGVDTARAATDPVVFLTALDVIAAHTHAGVAAYRGGEPKAGAEMFAHAFSEVYVDLIPALKTLGVPEFEPALQVASELALSGAPAAEVETAAGTVFEALAKAEAKAPPAAAGVDVEPAVFADMLDRAALQYAKARRDPSGDSYLDGYGFLEAAKARSSKVLAGLRASRPEAAMAAEAALDTLGKTYPSIKLPSDGAMEPGPALVATSKFRLALSAR